MNITKEEAALIAHYLGNQWINQPDQKAVYQLIEKLRNFISETK